MSIYSKTLSKVKFKAELLEKEKVQKRGEDPGTFFGEKQRIYVLKRLSE